MSCLETFAVRMTAIEDLVEAMVVMGVEDTFEQKQNTKNGRVVDGVQLKFSVRHKLLVTCKHSKRIQVTSNYTILMEHLV